MAIRTITVDNISYPIANDKVTQTDITGNTDSNYTNSILLSSDVASTGTTTSTSNRSQNLLYNESIGAIAIKAPSNNLNVGKIQIQGYNNGVYAVLRRNTEGTSSTVGVGELQLGRSVAEGNEGNAIGRISIFGYGTGANWIYPGNTSSTSYTNTIPAVAGYFAVGVTTGVGGSSTPVYMDANGELTSVTLNSTASNLINSLSVASANMSTTGYIITGDAASTTSSTFYKRPATSIVNSSLVKAALGTTTTTASKVLSDTGDWVDPDIYSFKLYGGTDIPEGANLNSYTTPGSYYVSTDAKAKTILNNPISAAASTYMHAFRLYVIASTGTGTAYRWQILRVYDRPQQEWRRISTDSGSSWAAWTNIANVDEKVDQNVTDTNASYPVLLGATSGATTTYNGEARYSVRTSVNALTGQFISSARPSSDVGVGGGYDIYNANGKISAKLWHYSDGTASTIGWGGLQVGNNVASGTAGNEQGFIYLYGSGAGKHQIDSDYATGTGYFHLPNISGTAAMLEGAQTFAGAKTFGTTVYFANGTTYNVSSTGTGTFNSLEAKGNLYADQKIIGKSGTVSAGNYTTTIPTAAGTTGQIMFVLST